MLKRQPNSLHAQLLHSPEVFGGRFRRFHCTRSQIVDAMATTIFYSVQSCLGSDSQYPQVTCQKPRLAPIARHRAGKHSMKEERYVEHAIFADLQVATHHIRAHQPEMLTVLDTALADARTLAHRIINQDNQGDIVAGATKFNHQRGGPFLCLEQYNRPIGNCSPILDNARAIADQMAPQQVYQGANQIGRGSALPEQAMAAN